MRLPSLASRPFLNTRPVWIFTVGAVILGLMVMMINVSLYLSSNQKMELQLQRRAQLEKRLHELRSEVGKDAEALAKVPWKRLGREAAGLDEILRAYGFSWQRLLFDVGVVLPRQVRLQRITPTVTKEGLSLSFTGTAQTRDAILELLQNLIDDPHFEKPLPKSERTPEEAGVGYEFSLKVLYHPEGAAP